MKFNPQLVEHLAALAGLSLAIDEAEVFASQLSLRWDRLSALDELTPDLDSTAPQHLAADILRPDLVRSSFPCEELFLGGPHLCEGGLPIPYMLK